MVVRPLFGRDHEADVVARLLTGARQDGQALVLRGEAGIGKSALLNEATGIATDQNMLVLKAVGVQPEADLPFAGLHQLLWPILGRGRTRCAARWGRSTARAGPVRPRHARTRPGTARRRLPPAEPAG